MASNGLLNLAKRGTCRICQRARKTLTQVKKVGEINHGFACGYIWECIDTEECDRIVAMKLQKYEEGTEMHERIKSALSSGRITEYQYRT